MNKYISTYDAVVDHLKKSDRRSSIQVAVPESPNLDSKYLFPNEPSNRHTEYTAIIEFLQQRLSSHK